MFLLLKSSILGIVSFKRQRKLGLKFLSKYLLKEDIQSKTHDSIEDARTALKLYEKYEEMQMYGDFDEQLLEIYRFGKMFGFKEVDEATKAADDNTTTTGKKSTATTKGVRDDKSVNDELIQSTSMLSFGANEFLPPSSQNVHHSSAAAVAAAAAAAAAFANVTAQAQQQQRGVDNVLAFQPPPPPSFAPAPPPFAPPPVPNMAPPAGTNQRFAEQSNNNIPPPPGGRPPAAFLAPQQPPQPPAKPPPLAPRRL